VGFALIKISLPRAVSQRRRRAAASTLLETAYRREKSPADLRLARPSSFVSSLFHVREAERREAFLGLYRLSATTPVIGGRAACRRSTAIFFSFGVPLFVEA